MLQIAVRLLIWALVSNVIERVNMLVAVLGQTAMCYQTVDLNIQPMENGNIKKHSLKAENIEGAIIE